MRPLVLILAIAVAFGAAAAWQSRKVAALKAERVRAAAIADGLLAETESGEVQAGWAVITVGRPAGPSGAARVSESIPRSDGESDAESRTQLEPGVAPATQAPQASTQTTNDSWSADWELTVEAGQSLSKIASAHYGTATAELVAALARYNALSSPDELRAGQRLRLPPLDVLLRQ